MERIFLVRLILEEACLQSYEGKGKDTMYAFDTLGEAQICLKNKIYT